MSLSDAVASLQFHPHIIDKFAESITPKLIEQALAASGVATIRRRKLPAEQVVWLMIGMSLFTNTSIHKVLDRLNLVANGHVVSSAVSQARSRLGAAPLSWLFSCLAKAWTQPVAEANYQGMQLFGIDGTVMNVQDTKENYEYFGRPGSKKGLSGYPQARVVALMELGVRILLSAEITPLAVGEMSSAKKLVEKIPGNSLVLMDRGFVSYRLFAASCRISDNKNFLCRIRSNTRLRVDERLPDGSTLGTLFPASSSDKKDSQLPSEIKVRLIEYKIEGSDTVVRLFTSLLDNKKHPAKKLAELYHMRWELEIAFDELKTDLLIRKECLRSKFPEGVMQEIWSTLLTYNLVRREMALIAQSHRALPASISFKTAVLFICDFFLVHSSDFSVGRMPEHLRRLRSDLWRHRNPARRIERVNPRAVKIKISSYLRKPGIDHSAAQRA